MRRHLPTPDWRRGYSLRPASLPTGGRRVTVVPHQPRPRSSPPVCLAALPNCSECTDRARPVCAQGPAALARASLTRSTRPRPLRTPTWHEDPSRRLRALQRQRRWRYTPVESVGAQRLRLHGAQRSAIPITSHACGQRHAGAVQLRWHNVPRG